MVSMTSKLLIFLIHVTYVVTVCSSQKMPAAMYGISQTKSSPGINLVKVNTKDGKMVVLETVKYEAVAQELSSIDRLKNIYYVIGLNNTGQYKHPALLGFDLNNKGKLVTEVQLPFFELAFVGVSQAVQVDPVTSNVVLVGLDGTKNPPYHNVLLYDIEKKDLSEIVHIPGSGIAVLGASSTIDDQGDAYFTFALNTSGKVSTSIFVVPTRGPKVGTYTEMMETNQHHLGTMDFDMKTKRIYGVLGAAAGTWELGFYDVAKKSWYSKPILLEEKWTGGMASVAAFSSSSRSLSLLLQQGKPEKPFQPSNTCSPKCGKDALCCIDPTEGTASCFAVKTCSRITPGGGAPNMTLPFKLAQFDVDTGALISSPDLCTLANCPWSLESE
jgi:hypothetical protein